MVLQQTQEHHHKLLTLEALDKVSVVMEMVMEMVMDFHSLDRRDLQRQQAQGLQVSMADMVMDLAVPMQLLNQVPTLSTRVVSVEAQVLQMPAHQLTL